MLGKGSCGQARETDAAIGAQYARRWGRMAIGRESGNAIRRPVEKYFFRILVIRAF
ncbi:hypothetical protein BO443_80039 [Burkholderia orbicola]